MFIKSVLVLNLKNYENALLGNALVFLDVLEKFFENFNVEVFLVPNVLDLKEVAFKARNVKILSPVALFSDFGPYTGSFSVETLKKIGVCGVLMNHSENSFVDEKIKNILEIDDFIKILCLSSDRKLEFLDDYVIDYIAVEPPSYIGKKCCVLDDEPEFLKPYVKKYKNVLIGAGISSGKDVNNAMKEGAMGILIASAVVLAEDPYLKLAELFAGFRK